MSMSDPISDMLTRIRNAQMSGKEIVSIPLSKIKYSISRILKEEGYISDFFIEKEKKIEKNNIKIHLKYYLNNPVIERIDRISRPGLRIYKKKDQIPNAINGLGIVIVSTSCGVMTGHDARSSKIGGELICYIQ